MIRFVRRYVALSVSEHRLLIEAAVWVAVIGAAVKLGRVARLRPILAFFSRPRVIRETSGAAPVAWAVTAVSNRFPRWTTCLVTALTTHVMLRRRGLPSAVHVGVKGRGESARVLDAHAWTVSDGKVVVGAIEDLASYTVLSGARFP